MQPRLPLCLDDSFTSKGMKYIRTHVAIVTPYAQLCTKSIFEQSENITWALIGGMRFIIQCPCTEIVMPIYVCQGLFTGIYSSLTDYCV